MLSSYFNYISITSMVTFAIALLFVIPLGLYLCRNNLKFVLFSMLGLTYVTIYLSQSTVGAIAMLQKTDRGLAAAVLQYAVPVAFFAVAGTGLIRYGLDISTGGNTTKQPGPRFGERWTSFRHWFVTREGAAVSLIALAMLSLHLVYVANPLPPTLLDELYYVTDANKFLTGQAMVYPEHPPLAKWLIAAGIFLFGDNGARLFPILFSTAGIFVFYFICRRLVGGHTFVPILAAFLFATENMSFVMGHTAMLDVFGVTFMLLGFLFYLRGNYLLSGVTMGLALLSKEATILGIAAIAIHWTFEHASELRKELKYTWHELNGRPESVPSRHISGMFQLLAAAALVWGLLIVPLEYRSMHQYPGVTQWFNPVVRATYMLVHPMSQTFGMDLGNSLIRPRLPWLWAVSPSAINVAHAAGPGAPHYLASLGWNILPLVVPVIVYLTYYAIRYRKQRPAVPLFLLSWIVGVYGLLMLLELVTHRIMFDFYFYAAIPALCAAIAWAGWNISQQAKRSSGATRAFKATGVLYLAITAAVFFIMSPLSSGLIHFP